MQPDPSTVLLTRCGFFGRAAAGLGVAMTPAEGNEPAAYQFSN